MKRIVVISLCVFFTLASVTCYTVYINHNLWEKEQQLLLKDVVDTQAATIEKRLTRSLAATYFLKSIIEHNQAGITQQAFGQYAKNIIASLGGITNLQLAPNGVVEFIYPLEGHEKALGHNIFRDDARRTDATRALMAQELTLAGPFELVQGGTAIIGRNPIFVTDKNGEQTFWGFASALIYLNEIITSNELDALQKKGYHYQLSKLNHNTNTTEIFVGDADATMTNSIEQSIAVPNDQWLLRISRPASSALTKTDILYYVFSVLFSGLGAYLVFVLLKQPLSLRKIVTEKTQELETLAHYDPLTGLCNRRLFQDLTTHAIEHSLRTKSMVALLYLDLDQFKRVNDTLGHQAGDQLLIEVAARLQKVMRKSDVIARIGGDEFCVLLTEFNGLRGASSVAEKIIDVLREPMQLNGQMISTTPSIGITFTPDDADNFNDLLKNADLAMYAAKNAGRDNFIFYNHRMNTEARERLTKETELRAAIQQNEFTLYFQPIVSLSNKKIKHLEALIRWQHPEKGIVGPMDFIPLAEETGLIIPLGQWVIKEACQQIKQLNRMGATDINISQNLSVAQFKNTNLVKDFNSALAETGISPNRIQVEITESAFMQDPHQSLETIQKLKNLGMTIAIDDFGTGYSSFSQIKNLPIDVLKIDRSFINNMNDKDGRQIVEALVGLAQKLDLSVVAEGIETIVQLEFLRSIHCALGQGYLLSKPLPLPELQKLIQITVEKSKQQSV